LASLAFSAGEGPSGKLESVLSRKTETLKGGELSGGRSARTPALLSTQGNARSQVEVGMWRGRARRGRAGQAFPPKARLHGQSSFRVPGPLARARRAGRTTGPGTWPFLSFRSYDHVAGPLLESRKRLRRMSFVSSRDTEEQPHLGPFGKLLFL